MISLTSCVVVMLGDRVSLAKRKNIRPYSYGLTGFFFARHVLCEIAGVLIG